MRARQSASLSSMVWRSLHATLLRSLCAFALLSGAADLRAASVADSLQVHGFLSQAAFYTSDNNLHGESNDAVSTDMNEAGINAAIKLRESWRLAGQITSRNDGKSDNGEIRTDYFNIDWQFLTQESWRLGARAGRVRNLYGLYNGTRDVAHTRPGISLPMVAYLDQVRDVFVSRDGYAVYGDYYSDAGTLAFDAGQGDIPVDDDIVSEALLMKVDAKAVDPHTDQFQLRWDDASGNWRLAYSYLRFASDINYDGNDFSMALNNVSIQYTAERWQLTSELVRFDYRVNFLIAAHYPGEIAYLQYSYFLTPDWQLYTRYEYSVFDRHHRNGSSMEPYFPRQVGYRRDAGLGVRWDIDQHWMVAAEAHYIEGVLGISINDNTLAKTSPYWDMVAVQAAFRF